MAITYEHDVGPHLQRQREIRTQRLERAVRLHEHSGRAVVWRVALGFSFLFWGFLGYELYLFL